VRRGEMPIDQELQFDLDITEFIFYRTKDPKARVAINKLRYLIIVEIHKQQSVL